LIIYYSFACVILFCTVLPEMILQKTSFPSQTWRN